MPTYTFKPGPLKINLDPQSAGARLHDIAEREGGLTPLSVVTDAKDEASPLHSHFEWNDERAANEHRLEQARYLIRHVSVKIESNEGEARNIRAFVSVSRDEERAYIPILTAMGDADMRKQVLQRAWRELEGWRLRYKEYEELGEVFSAMETVAPTLPFAQAS